MKRIINARIRVNTQATHLCYKAFFKIHNGVITAMYVHKDYKGGR